MSNKEEIIKSIEDRRDLLIKASDSIWEFAETRFQEDKSSELLKKNLINKLPKKLIYVLSHLVLNHHR